MIRNCGLLTLAYLLFTLTGFAQNVNGSMPVNDISIASGLSSTPGSDIVNVDLYTGIGTATVPIYNYSLQGLDFGISLSYNLKGIQVDQISSPIGLGWSLNIGGEMSRSTIALEDEVGIKRKDTQYGAFLYNGAWVGLTGSHRDNEYDHYNLSFGGRSLEMIWGFNNSNKLMTYPKSEISIRTVATNRNVHSHYNDYDPWTMLPGICKFGDSTINDEMSFHVIDEKGNQFFFRPGNIEKKHYEIEESDSGTRWVPNTWVLTKVLTNTGAEIIYNYQWKYTSYKSAEIETTTEYFKTTGANPPDLKLEIDPVIWNGYIAQVSSINYPNGVTAIFHWDTSSNVRCDNPGGYVVDSITIQGNYNTSLVNTITYKLNHSYFHSPTSYNSNTEVAHRTACNSIESSNIESATTRLKLNSIDRVGSDHVQSERFYTFDYHSTPLPARLLSKAKDFYGYYNNATTTEIVISGIQRHLGIPIHSYNDNHNPVRTYGTDRTPDTSTELTYIQAGLLKKITNGLGGIIEINYEKPDISNSNCGYRDLNYIINFSTGNVGSTCSIDPELEGQNATDGLVISSLLIKDGFSDENDINISYEYSGGERFFRGGYFWYPTWVKGDIIKAREYKNTMVSEHSYFRGSNHGFSEVSIVRTNNYSSEQLSKVKYEYSNLFLPNPLTDLFIQDYVDSSNTHYYQYGLKPAAGLSCLDQMTGPRNHTTPPNYMEKFMMGLVKSVTEYDENNDITSQTINKYDLNFRDIDGIIHERWDAGRKFFYREVDDNFNYTSSGYTFKPSFVSPLVSSVAARIRYTKIIKKTGNRELIEEYNYDYDYVDNVKSISWIDSKGNHFKKENYYTYDYHLYDNYLKTSLQYLLTKRTLKVFPTLPSYDVVLSHSVIVPYASTQKTIYPSELSNVFGNGVWFINRLGDTIPPGGTETRYIAKKYLPKIQFPHVYESTINQPITIATANSDESSAISAASGLSSLTKLKEYTLFDDINNVLEMRVNELDKYQSFVWDSRVGHKVAEVNNARYNQIAYTSFEGFNVVSPIQTDYGNWNFDAAGVVFAPHAVSPYPKAMTGKYLYNLNVNPLTTNLQPNIDYTLTFWADVDPKVMLGGVQLSLQTVHTVSSWKLYTVKFNSASYSTLTIMDNSALQSVGFIDEARLYPSDATMTSTTYEPLFGVSSTCDERNNITYTEYDKLGRAVILRDMNGYIRTKIETKNQTTNN